MIKRLAYIFGDSVMKGVVFEPNQAKYQNTNNGNYQAFSKQFDFELVNRSRFGSTIQKGIETVHQSVEKNPDMTFAILEFGGNDCDFDWKKVAESPLEYHDPKTPLPLFIKLYKDLIAYLRNKNILPIMMNLPPVDGERYLDFLVSRGLSREAILANIKTPDQISRFQELYSISIERIAHETNTPLVDCRSAFLDRRDIRKTICEDGIHPTEEGHKLIYQSFMDFMSKLPQEMRDIIFKDQNLRLLQSVY